MEFHFPGEKPHLSWVLRLEMETQISDETPDYGFLWDVTF